MSHCYGCRTQFPSPFGRSCQVSEFPWWVPGTFSCALFVTCLFFLPSFWSISFSSSFLFNWKLWIHFCLPKHLLVLTCMVFGGWGTMGLEEAQKAQKHTDAHTTYRHTCPESVFCFFTFWYFPFLISKMSFSKAKDLMLIFFSYFLFSEHICKHPLRLYASFSLLQYA